MSPVRYDYDRGSDSGSGGSRTRAVVIFIIALGVIGCAIYYFIMPHGGPPGKDTPPEVVTPPSDKHAQGGASAKETAAGKSVSGTSADAPPSENPPPAPPAAESRETQTAANAETGPRQVSEQPEAAPPQNAENAANAGVPTGADGTVPKNVADLSGNSSRTEAPPSENKPTADPQKGKPWIGDPPSEQPSAGNAEAGKAAPAKDDSTIDPAKSAVTVEVRSGDSLSRIAYKHVIRIGQKLRVIPGPWRITVNKGRRELTLERLTGENWSEFAKFPVGLGRMNSTPEAQFVISTRLRHPDWYTPDGRIYRYGDAENQLGDYFLKLAMTGTPDKPLLGYGIHGTSDEKSVGKNWSSGCVRMRNRDVEILYYLVPSGTPVKIAPGADDPRKTEI